MLVNNCCEIVQQMFVRQPTDNLKGNYIDFSVKMSEKQAKQMIVFKIRFGMVFSPLLCNKL